MHDKSLLLLCVSVKIELESYVFQNSNLLPRRIWILQVPPMYYVVNPMTLLHATPASYSLYFTYHFSSISTIQPRHILVRCSSGIYDNTFCRSVNCAVNSLDYKFIVPTHFPGSGMRLGLFIGHYLSARNIQEFLSLPCWSLSSLIRLSLRWPYHLAQRSECYQVRHLGA